MKLFLAALAASAVLVSGCATTSSTEAKAEPTDPTESTATPAPEASAAALKAPGEAAVGDKTTCPVSGEEFVVEADSPKVEYKGKTFYACCDHCVEKLNAEPEKYLGQYAQ